MIRKKNHTLILFLSHVLQFILVAGAMYAVLSKTTLGDEALSTLDQSALMQKNVVNSLMIGLVGAVSGFLMWYFYILPLMMKEREEA